MQLPRVGQLTVESLALIVNGHELHTFTPNVTHRQGNPEWKQPLARMTRDEEFIGRLRMTLNRGNNSDRPGLDQILAGPLTTFTVAGFSGWLPYLRHSNLHVTNKYLQATSKTKRSAQDKLVEAIMPLGLVPKTTLVQ